MDFKLRDWQVEPEQRQYDILKARGVALNASGTGTGKTYMAAATAARLGLPVLTVCPKSVTTAWRQVFEAAGVVGTAINWEKLKTRRYGFWNGEKWVFDREYFVILDEIHYGTTGPYSQITAMAAKLRAFPTLPKLMLSATLADSPLQMRASGFLMGLHHYADADFWQWCLRMGCTRQSRPNGQGGFTQFIGMPKGVKAANQVMAAMRELIGPFMVRITPDEVPGFPETEIVAKCFDLDAKLTAEQRRIYEPLALQHRTLSTDERAKLLVGRQRLEIMKVPVLAELVKGIIADGRSAVVFMNFLEPMDRLAMELGTDSVVQIRGGQTDSQRQAAMAAFQDNSKHICLAQAQAGGISINLHDVHKARPRTALICPDWDAKKVVQCLGRTHRDGGTKTLQIFVLAASTMEENVARVVNRKRGCITTLNDGDLEGRTK